MTAIKCLERFVSETVKLDVKLYSLIVFNPLTHLILINYENHQQSVTRNFKHNEYNVR